MAAFRILLLFFIVLTTSTLPLSADRIVLRNLDIIRGKTVTQFDEDGVRLDDGSKISWDQIENGRVADSLQADFDKLLSELGAPLYRIRQRLSINDYRGLLPYAEAMYDRFRNRNSETSYMVCQALMWSRLAVGKREAALSPYLHCLEYIRQSPANQNQIDLPGKRRLKVDLETGFSPELPPIWFDVDAAQEQLPEVTGTIASMKKPHLPATRIYYATLALAADQPQLASQVLSGLTQLPAWKSVVEAQVQLTDGDAAAAIKALEPRIDTYSTQLRPMALYWLGKSKLAGATTTDSNIEAGLLDLLRIPALHGDQQPELAAAGLHEAMRQLAESGNIKGSIALRRELLDRYGQTWHAEQVRTADKKAR